MAYHLTILREEEYQEIKKERQERRRDERRQKQWEAEKPYNYSKEKQAELLKQRDLPKELAALKRRRRQIMLGLWLLSAVFGVACGRMLKRDQMKSAVLCETLAITSVVAAGIKWRSYDQHIRMKKDEITCAKAGWINPTTELYRQEGKVYY